MILKSINKAFDKKIIFKDFSYEFKDKGIYLLLGESGRGKTTLLRLIAGLDRDYSGEIIGGGKVSFAFQEHRLFPQLSALDNLIFAISDRKDEAVAQNCKNMLSKLGFSEDDMKLTPDSLSGGMRQRVSVARALLFDAPVLLLDEPTKELDEANAAIIRELIYEESKKRLVILVSHISSDFDFIEATKIIL